MMSSYVHFSVILSLFNNYNQFSIIILKTTTTTTCYNGIKALKINIHYYKNMIHSLYINNIKIYCLLIQ